jgi:hypothetical protein
MTERRDNYQEHDIDVIRGRDLESGSMNQRLMDEMKATIQAEIKVVAQMVSGLKDKVFEFGKQLTEIKHTHEICQSKSLHRSERNNEQIQDIKLEISDLKHADIDPVKIVKLEEVITDLKDKHLEKITALDKRIEEQDMVISLLRRAVYILAVAFGTAIAKVAIDTIFKFTTK